LIGNPEY